MGKSEFWTGAAGTVASVGLTMTSLADTLDRTKEYAATGDISAKSGLTPADIGMAMTSAIASSLNEKSGTINDNVWVIGGKGLGDLYETGVSILNSLASVYMLGGVGTYANFFGQASKTAYEEGIQRGLSVDKGADLRLRKRCRRGRGGDVLNRASDKDEEPQLAQGRYQEHLRAGWY